MGHEGGDDALALLPQLFGIQTPPVYRINSTDAMKAKLDYIMRFHAAYGWKTVVIDGLNFYQDIYEAEVVKRYQIMGKDPQMQQRDWGFLEKHVLFEIVQPLNNTPLNIIYICAAKEKFSAPNNQGEKFPVGYEPMMRGQTKFKLPFLCKMSIFADKEQVIGSNTVQPIYRTSATPQVKEVRHKYGNSFPEGYLIDPEFGTWPTFRAVDCKIGQFIYK
jgi:hypothetical protein